VPCELLVDLAKCRAPLHADASAVVENLHRPESTADVHEDAIGHRLAGQTRAAGPERQMEARLGTGPHQASDPFGAVRRDHHLWGEQDV